MCGVMADMQIIAQIMKNLMPKVSEILEEKEENCGDFIGNNLINQGLNNIFTNDMLNNDTSLLIWDCLFLEGNFVLIKGILALYACLEPILIKSQRSIETFKKIKEVDLKNIKPDNDELINYLFIKQFDFDEEYINEAETFELDLSVYAFYVGGDTIIDEKEYKCVHARVWDYNYNEADNLSTIGYVERPQIRNILFIR